MSAPRAPWALTKAPLVVRVVYAAFGAATLAILVGGAIYLVLDGLLEHGEMSPGFERVWSISAVVLAIGGGLLGAYTAFFSRDSDLGAIFTASGFLVLLILIPIAMIEIAYWLFGGWGLWIAVGAFSFAFFTFFGVRAWQDERARP